jgi:hypothetical protein
MPPGATHVFPLLLFLAIFATACEQRRTGSKSAAWQGGRKRARTGRQHHGGYGLPPSSDAPWRNTRFPALALPRHLRHRVAEAPDHRSLPRLCDKRSSRAARHEARVARQRAATQTGKRAVIRSFSDSVAKLVGFSWSRPLTFLSAAACLNAASSARTCSHASTTTPTGMKAPPVRQKQAGQDQADKRLRTNGSKLKTR